MIDKSQKSTPRLVTLILFAYNQESYVSEAIQSALNQDCDNLEIILSDDCSSDNTFIIMKKMAEAYIGKHSVKARQQSENKGLVNHVIEASRCASGEFLVLAAGDDISYPNRARRLYEYWREYRCSCINSRYDEIDVQGQKLRDNVRWGICKDTQRIFKNSRIAVTKNGIAANTVGFSAAYPREFWANLPLSSKRLMIEDGLATCLINCQGGQIHTVEESLLSYRIHEKSLSNRVNSLNRDSIIRRENRINNGAHDIISRVDYIFMLNDKGVIYLDTTDKVMLGREKHYGEILYEFWNLRYFERLMRILKSKSIRELSFVVPRCFGLEVFKGAKIFIGKLSNFIKLEF